MKYNKKFLIIGNKNAVIYKDLFTWFTNNKIWYGYNMGMSFEIPYNATQKNAIKLENGNYIVKTSATAWFTNLTHNKVPEKLKLYKKYNKNDYPEYDNYNAINVNKVKDIPLDYKGVMGVPITFFIKFNPEQFEILGMTKNTTNAQWLYKKNVRRSTCAILDGRKLYTRLLIRWK